MASLALEFETWLAARGYRPGGLAGQRGLVGHLNRWLAARELRITDLSPSVLETFLETRRAEGYASKLTARGLMPLLAFLAERGLYTAPTPPMTDLDGLIGRFGRHLRDERGLGEGTAAGYERVARQFLSVVDASTPSGVAGLTAGDVTAFVLVRSEELSVAGMQTMTGGLKALLRFLFATGFTERDLVSAVPTAARRRPDLPRALPGSHVERLLDSCDRTKPVGLRDFAVLTTLARLGLRANEVAGLRLDDIDWSAGEIRIRGKGPRTDRLPLPATVGEPIADYLLHARPRCHDRRVFLRSCAPWQGLTRQAIGGLVRAASRRAGLDPHGPHRLRHTVATDLVRRGAPLIEIAQLLRHQNVQTTAIYAKVDLDALSALVQPWPEARA
ncbi:MAG: site-specific integrase [Acidimicrobiales bacterium]